MNKSLARVAESGVNSGEFEQEKGFCLRMCREAAEEVPGIGIKYDRLFRGDGTHRDATATRAGHRFLAAGLGFLREDAAKHGGLQPGDMLVKTDVAPNRWGDMSGHIGILCMDERRMAENSSTSIGRVRGALGFRSLTQYGNWQIAVRLPDPNINPIATPKFIMVAKPPRAVLNGRVLMRSKFEGGKAWAPITDVLDLLNIDILKTGDQMEESGRFYIYTENKTS